MIIIGLDPGSIHFGYSVLNYDKTLELLDFGVINSKSTTDLSKRIYTIYSSLDEIFSKYKPDIVSIEEAFYHKNVRSLMILSHVRAIGLLLSEKYNAVLKEYSARKIKLSIASNGNADKSVMRKIIAGNFSMAEENIPLDASDAIAAGLCAYYDSMNNFLYSSVKKKKNKSKWDLDALKTLNIKYSL
ncbi:MAG: Holliday junction resolvase [uncultured bacterium]|nr:MAG: Holliday junction resolvase [uncultured bacterium]